METSDLVSALVLVLGAALVAGSARYLRVPGPILLVIVGLAVSYVPFVPEYELDPEVVLLFFLPPLLYSAAWRSSARGIKLNLRPIGLLSVGYVLFSTILVGLVAWALIPSLPLAAAFALGAIVAPPDAVAASAVGRELGLPRRVLTILQGESLVNDATALTAYRVAVAAAGAGITFWQGAGMFVLAAGGGVAMGFVLAVILERIRRRLRDSLITNTINLLTPFAVYVAAEAIHSSGVIAVVIAGLYLGNTSTRTSSAVRLQATATWDLLDFVLESIVFLLIGLQLPIVIHDLHGRDPIDVIWWAAVIVVVTIVGRIVWVFPATYVPRFIPGMRDWDIAPNWRLPAVISWAGMRGVVSLAAAFTLAADFPERDLVLVLTFAVVFGTLVVQGLTLPWVIRRLGIAGTEDSADLLAEANAQHQAARAALDRLDKLVEESPHPLPADVVDRLRAHAQNRSDSAWERLGGGVSKGGKETPTSAFRRLRQEMVRAQRDEFVRLRDSGELDDEVMREVVRELDLEEAMLDRH
jgi:CPA1 family monovalent cation:H+ antiporter